MSLEHPTRPGQPSTYDGRIERPIKISGRGKRRYSHTTNQTKKLKNLYEMYLLASFGRKIITEHPLAG